MSTSVYSLGLDPGSTGAIALLRWDGALKTMDLSADPLEVCDRFRELLACAGSQRVTALIEQAHAMPAQGVVSAFHYGMGYGGLLHLLSWAGIPYQTIRAATWKKALGLTAEKSKSLAMARSLYPTADLHRVKDHNRAEAILLAHLLRKRGL